MQKDPKIPHERKITTLSISGCQRNDLNQEWKNLNQTKRSATVIK